MNDNIPPGYNSDGKFVGFPLKSQARREWWSKIPSAERTARMSVLGKRRQALLTPEQRKALATKASKASHVKLSTDEQVVKHLEQE